MKAVLLLLLGLLLAIPPAVSAEEAPTFDRRKAKVVTAFAETWWKARPPNRFVEWDPKVRARLREEAMALGALPEGKRAEALEALWKPVKKLGPRQRGNKLSTPYGDATFILNGAGRNKGLILGLHGGGEGAGSAGSATSWKMPKCMGIYPQGIRLVHDTWCTVHGERFLLSLIEIAKSQYQIDPDRVYVGGFSMGGTGSWFMAGRHPDLLAGAMPYHGVLMASPKSQVPSKESVLQIEHGVVPNVRNLAMWYTTGMVDRNCMPGTYLFAWDVILGLREEDPGGYRKIHFKAHEKVAHAFPAGEPGNGIKFLEKQTRDSFPETVVWEICAKPFPRPGIEDREMGCSRLPKRWFYWLHLAEPNDRRQIRATRKGNEITIEDTGALEGLTIFLNETMIDVEREVVVKSDGKEVYRGRPEPDLWTVLESLDARMDRTLVFDRRIVLGR